MNSSELLRNSEVRSPFYERDAVGNENLRVKLQNVVANSIAINIRMPTASGQPRQSHIG